ncbi:bifunctional DNA primase/polymerase [Halostagnicola kamekurae]|uniref:Bifunctional DNA primase/polymerase, N-terminal n=1 Tax=Halostagnicola kamekurae TaxID=619731 RepID=A0A1I6RMK6_9EURY|nr:bifunctional DNA primase/polymerase [Halostagnicola kamekurae]SFS65947.1 Bifunctional DNA primase/polymerase, N-terminal [Halostagnicola kamekurae]
MTFDMRKSDSNRENSSAPRSPEDVLSKDFRRGGTCNHENPVCTCYTSDSERAALLKEYIGTLTENGWRGVQLMPLDGEGKRPIISGRCRLDSDEAKSLLVDAEDAIQLIEQDGERGFCLYAGKPEHGTSGLVFTDHDDPDLFPADSDTLTVISGSGRGYHQTFENGGDVQNAKGKEELNGAGEIRAENQYVVLPGSIHPSGGIYHVESNPGIGKLESGDLPQELLPSNETSNSEPIELDTEVPDSLGDIEANFNVEKRYQTMLNSMVSETIEAVIEGNLSKTRFENDRHQAEGWFAEQVGFYMERNREVIEQVLTTIFNRNPETDAHADDPDKSSERKFLRDDHHREQILDYATSKDTEYDPGLGITKYTREERPEVSYPVIDRVQDALSDLVLARKGEIVEHPRVDRKETQVYEALRKMQDSDDVPLNVKSIKDGRKRYYYLESHAILIPEDRREELGIEVGI